MHASVFRNVHPIVAFKAEIDLSDEGSIKMLDAYARVFPVKDLNFTNGQMRVPFTIDAHRSPHQQYFANRSFIAKQVGMCVTLVLRLSIRIKVASLLSLKEDYSTAPVDQSKGMAQNAELFHKSHSYYLIKLESDTQHPNDKTGKCAY
jgi:hypothetical protein